MIHDNKKKYVTIKNLFLRKNQLYEMVLSNFFFVNQSITLNPKNEINTRKYCNCSAIAY